MEDTEVLAAYKTCSKCGESKPASEYFKDRQKSSGYRPDCKTCNVSKSVQWRRNNKERSKAHQRKHLYGITEDVYLRLRQEQEECCAICFTHESSLSRGLCVDHCHSTGKVRGLLCGNCNSAMGKLQEDEAIITSALIYIRKHANEP